MNKRKINEGPISALQRFSNSFFDGLKGNAVNSALKKAKNNKQIPVPVVEKMKEIDRLAAELQQMLDDIS